MLLQLSFCFVLFSVGVVIDGQSLLGGVTQPTLSQTVKNCFFMAPMDITYRNETVVRCLVNKIPSFNDSRAISLVNEVGQVLDESLDSISQSADNNSNYYIFHSNCEKLITFFVLDIVPVVGDTVLNGFIENCFWNVTSGQQETFTMAAKAQRDIFHSALAAILPKYQPNAPPPSG